MITKDNKDLAQWALEFALKNGCQQSKVKLYNGTSSSFEIRDMQVERLQQASENMLIVNFYVDGRFGSFSTNRLDKQELERYIPMNIEATRFLAEDRARTLPDESRYYKGGMPDLQLLDAGFDKITPEEKKAMALEACAEMCGKDAKVISAASAYGDEQDFKYMITSNGFEGESSSSYFSIYANVFKSPWRIRYISCHVESAGEHVVNGKTAQRYAATFKEGNRSSSLRGVVMFLFLISFATEALITPGIIYTLQGIIFAGLTAYLWILPSSKAQKVIKKLMNRLSHNSL